MDPAFRLLGPLEVRTGSGAAVHLGGPKPRALLALLLLHRGDAVSVDRLVDTLWGEGAGDAAATTLRSHVARVRQALLTAGVPANLTSRSGGYALEVEAEQVDAELFERRLARGRDAATAGRHAEAAELLADALDLWRGDVLADLPGLAAAVAADLTEKRLAAL
ncbi:MAG TPA: BTAD domain-containing putative transcriptional regulator, partial [Nocardioides sp.]|nr:BTAD domain-containing putative transcriptional regulator [Nocardioides sp.]